MSVSKLVAELKSPDANTRLAACTELGKRSGLEAMQAVEDLQVVADNDPDPKVQKAAAQALAGIKANELN
jgi:HEAT repeat protein